MSTTLPHKAEDLIAQSLEKQESVKLEDLKQEHPDLSIMKIKQAAWKLIRYKKAKLVNGHLQKV